MARTIVILCVLLLISCQPARPVSPTPSYDSSGVGAPLSTTWNGGRPYINGYGEPTYSKPTRGTVRFQQQMSAIRRSYHR